MMQQVEAKKVLVKWAEEMKISPSEFASAMHYTYVHAWGLLRGERQPTLDLVGRMLSAYGPEAAQLISDALNGAAESQPKEA